MNGAHRPSPDARKVPQAHRHRAGFAALLAASSWLLAAPGAAPAEALLRGPHPFLKENALSFSGGFNAAGAGAVGGTRAQLGYGYDLLGSLWLDLQIAMVDGSKTNTGGQPCASCGQSWEVMGGVAYRLQMNVPVIPYAKIDGGLIFFFPDLGGRHAGLAARGAVGGKYFLYDWLGFGIELGALLGNAGRDAGSTRSSTVAALDLTAGVEWQF